MRWLSILAASLLLTGCIEARHSAPLRTRANARANPSFACRPIVATGTAPAIDDFESERRKILTNEGRAGWWYAFDDGTGGHLVRELADVSVGTTKSRALHVKSSGFVKWGAGFGFNVHPSATQTHACAYDASAYDGVRFRARGRGRVRVVLGDPSNIPPALGGLCARPVQLCHDRPGVWANLGAEWKAFVFPFCAFVPEGWGGSRTGADPRHLVGIQFRTEAHEDIELWLDDLEFYHSVSGVAEPHCGAPCPLEAVPSTARIEPNTLMGSPAPGLTVHTFEQNTKSCGALTRRYLSYVPGHLNLPSSAPVLIMLHGSGGNAETARAFHAHDRFDGLADRDGFVVVYGNAAPGAQTSPNPDFPNTGNWRQAMYEDGQVDDVEYLTKIVADLTARGVIDGNNPLLLAGISNGGGMALEAVRRLPDTFTGVAAFMPYDGEEPKPVPPTHIKRLLFAYGINDPGMSDGYHRILAKQPALWARAMGLPAGVIAAPRQTTLPNRVIEGSGYGGKSQVALATRDSNVTEIDLIGPDDLTRVRVLILEHAGHFWPNPIQDNQDWVLDRWGLRNQDFDAADMTWEFMKPAVVAQSPEASRRLNQ